MENNVGLFLRRRAELSPSLEGLVEVESGRRLSYAELNLRSNRTAGLLRGLGIGRGDRVALLLPNGAEYVESFFAAAKIGAIVVPLNWRLVADELAFILKDSGATVLVYGHAFAPAVEDLQGRGSAGTDVRHWIQSGRESGRPAFAESYAELQASAPDEEPAIGARDDDELYIMYTSGTTGLPKGAVHTHASAIWACITINMTADMQYRDRYMVALPLFHVGALTPMTANVQRGVTNILLGPFDPRRAWRCIAEERVTVMLAVPAMLNFMRQVPDEERGEFASLRWCMSGAAPVPVTLIEAYARIGIEIHQVYGLTESCGPACLISPEDALARRSARGGSTRATSPRWTRRGSSTSRTGRRT
jgi:acyl-CoA synthetase (AMP-forming)/AMP-acid ligase II